MKKYFLFILIFFLSSNFCVYSKEKSQNKRPIQYKAYEKFDLQDFSIQGEGSLDGHLSLYPRVQGISVNKLPSKENFHEEMIYAIEDLK